MEALDKSAVLTQLQDKGLIALSVSSEEENAKKEHQSIWTMDISVKDIHRTKIKKKKLLTVMNQMGIMMKAGVSLSLAMSVLIGGEKDRKLKMILTEINEDLYTGTPISAAMAKFDAFPEIIVNIVESGETNGRLDVAFERCAEIIEKELAITTKIRGAMGYPAFLFILVIGLVVIMNIVVLPKFAILYKSSNKPLPPLTLGVMAISDFMINRWYVIVLVLLVLIFGFYFAKKYSYPFHLKLDQFKLKIPVIGTVLRQSYIARFSRIMSSLVEAGVDIVHSLEISRNVIPNLFIKDNLTQVIEDVKIGISINEAMSKFPIFDSLLISMLKVGEESGLLFETMDKLATLYEEQTNESTKRLTAMLEPAMTIIIGIVVAVIMISIVMPMFGMYGNITG